MTTEMPEMDMLYDFDEAAPAAPAQVQTADLVTLGLMRASKYTLVIQLLPHDNDPAGRLCLIGVQLDKQAPSISVIRGDELGVLPAPVWQLMEAQAQLAAASGNGGKKKKAEMPAPKTVSKQPQAPAPAPVVAAAAPVPAQPWQQVKQAQDDIYSLFDL